MAYAFRVENKCENPKAFHQYKNHPNNLCKDTDSKIEKQTENDIFNLNSIKDMCKSYKQKKKFCLSKTDREKACRS